MKRVLALVTAYTGRLHEVAMWGATRRLGGDEPTRSGLL